MRWFRIRITAVATSSVTMTVTVAALAVAILAEAAVAAAATAVADTDGPGVYRKTPTISPTALINPKHKLNRTVESPHLVSHLFFRFPLTILFPFILLAPTLLIAFFVISFLFPFLPILLLYTSLSFALKRSANACNSY